MCVCVCAGPSAVTPRVSDDGGDRDGVARARSGQGQGPGESYRCQQFHSGSYPGGGKVPGSGSGLGLRLTNQAGQSQGEGEGQGQVTWMVVKISILSFLTQWVREGQG